MNTSTTETIKATLDGPEFPHESPFALALAAARDAVSAEPDSPYRAFYAATYASDADDVVIADAVDIARTKAGLEPLDGRGGVFAVRRARADREAGHRSAYDPAQMAAVAADDARAVSGLIAREVFEDMEPGTSREDFVAALRTRLPALAAADAERAVNAELSSRSKPPQPVMNPTGPDPFEPVPNPVADARNQERHQLALAMGGQAAAEQIDEPEWQPPSLDDPTMWSSGRLPGLLASTRFDPTAEAPPPSWRVKHLLPKTGLGLLYGESQAGKSFLAVWLALSVAWGLPLFGKRTKPGGVAYIASEGGKSVVRRFRVADAKLRDQAAVAALCSKGGPPLTRAPVEIVHEAPNLSRDGNLDALSKTIRQLDHDFRAEGSHLALVVLDTWHASLGGAEENSSADAGHALRPLKEAVEATDAFVLIVHHPGKDAEKGARGTYALEAAMDTVIRLTVPHHGGPKPKPAHAPREAIITKQRDGETGGEFHFCLPVVEIGRDEDGDPVTTCVVEPTASPRVGTDGLAEHDRTFLDCVQLAITESGGERGRLDIARKAYIDRRAKEGTKPATARSDWYRRLKVLREADRIQCDDHDEWVWIPAPRTDVAD